MSRRTKSFTRR